MKEYNNYDESYCGAYCLYMIYLIDRGFRINNALNILVNQCKYPGMYNECFCLGCNDKVNDLRSSFANNDKVNDNQGTDSVRGMPTCFTDDKVNDNDKINVNDKVNDNDNVKFNDNDNDNDNVNANDNDKDNVNVYDNYNDETIYQRSSYNQGGSYNLRSSPNLDISPPRSNIIQTSPIAININDDLYSWLNDVDIITEAAFPDNFRCIISGPSECGKTFLLKKLILASIYFDKLYIIGPTGDQYHGIERINPKADV